jgi:hypothetical protein
LFHLSIIVKIANSFSIIYKSTLKEIRGELKFTEQSLKFY